MFNLLGILDDKKPLIYYLKPIKEKIEKGLGKKIEFFSVGIDMETYKIKFMADGREHVESSKMACLTIAKVLKKRLGNDGDFKQVVIHCTDTIVNAAVKLRTNEVKTISLSTINAINNES